MSNARIVTQIRDVADLVRGVTYKKEDSSSEPAHGLVPLLRATNINGELDFAALVYVPASCVSRVQYLAPGDSVIAASSGSLSVVGKSATLRHEWYGTFGAFCYALRPASAYVAPFYLSYFFQTSEYRSQVSRLAAGVNINNLKRQHLEELNFPLVSMAEQHRIVEAIESYFTRLDDAVATLERVRRNLKRYRASVLKAAVEGRLVPTEAELARAEGRSYEPASVLLERILDERRRGWEDAELAKMKAKGKAPKDDKWKAKYVEPVAPDTSELPELAEGWCWATMEQISSLVTDGDHNPPKRSAVGVPHLTAKSVKGWRLTLNGCSFVSDEGFAKTRARYEPLEGDVIVTCVGTVGECAIVPRAFVFSADRNLAAVRPLRAGVSARYVMYLLSSPGVQVSLREASGSTAQPHLYLSDLRALVIPLPPQYEESRIVSEVERLVSQESAASQQIGHSRDLVSRLRQSILKWAFEGRLVDQDPTDEPASRLLERIRAEREAKPARPVRARRRVRAPAEDRS